MSAGRPTIQGGLTDSSRDSDGRPHRSTSVYIAPDSHSSAFLGDGSVPLDLRRDAGHSGEG
ncbi:hypothetical protein K488DRAFT_92573 [Vararia minispora EC-137]|uniref:Uncharacterized protein n=1 Tax=Vararia minispora EC-137 TaxID=1314806 RepID=A0ACB8Q3Y8_9AGAM|nr:hypothetical protein K488DRAFT_92573 [Vararia minispora EC-137]